jgi:hypothetical protein
MANVETLEPTRHFVDLHDISVNNGRDGRNNLQSEYLQIAAKTRPEAGSEESTNPKRSIDALIAADPAKLTPTMRSIQGLAENFNQSDDKAKALEQFKGAFESTIAKSDDNFKQLTTSAEATLAKIGPSLEAKGEKLQTALAELGKIVIGKVPASDQERVKMEGSLWQMSEKKPDLRAALEKDMSQYKGLVPALKAADAAQKDAAPLMKQAFEIEKAGEVAIEDRVMSRMVYADVLDAANDKAGAKNMRMEGLAIQMSGGEPDVEEQLKKTMKEGKFPGAKPQEKAPEKTE